MTDTSETSALSPDISRSTEPPEDESPTVCYLCRQRKTKCDRKLPRCGYCIKAKVNCQYVAQPKKRGLRAGYVSELEARLGTYSCFPFCMKSRHTWEERLGRAPTDAIGFSPLLLTSI